MYIVSQNKNKKITLIDYFTTVQINYEKRK